MCSNVVYRCAGIHAVGNTVVARPEMSRGKGPYYNKDGSCRGTDCVRDISLVRSSPRAHWNVDVLRENRKIYFLLKRFLTRKKVGGIRDGLMPSGGGGLACRRPSTRTATFVTTKMRNAATSGGGTGGPSNTEGSPFKRKIGVPRCIEVWRVNSRVGSEQ